MDKTSRQRLHKAIMRSTIAVFFAVAFAVAVAFTLTACDNGGANDDPTGDGMQTEAVVTELEILKAPKKTVYAPGETFDGKGMVLRAKLSNGKNKALTLAKCTYSPDGALTANDTKITVSYGGKSVDQPITVADMTLSISSATVNGKTYPTIGTQDLTKEITVTQVYSDSEGKVVDEKVISDYELVLDYQPTDAAQDKEDIVCAPDQVKGMQKGDYKIFAKSGDVKSANSLDISVFNGFIVEAENAYDAQYGENKKPVNADTYQNYGSKPLPEDVPDYYTLIEKLRPGNNSSSNYSKGAGAMVFPNTGKMPGASGGQYLGETKIVKVYSFHIYSEVEAEAEMFVNVASAVIIDWYMGTASLQMNKAFELYIGDGAYDGANDTWDDSKRVTIPDNVEIKGTNFRDESEGGDRNNLSPEHKAAMDEFKSLGINENDYKCSRWSRVSIGNVHLQKGWNVIYLRNMFYDDTSYVRKGDTSKGERGDFIYINNESKGQGTNWGFNLDSFEVIFKDEEV